MNAAIIRRTKGQLLSPVEALQNKCTSVENLIEYYGTYGDFKRDLWRNGLVSPSPSEANGFQSNGSSAHRLISCETPVN
jgi:hypothetical protein